MSERELKMAEMLCTRLCHDLTGPIGAVNNGAEFISEDGFGMQGEAVDLIVSSAFSAVSRLQFYRFAYGRVKGQGEASLDDKKQLVEDFFRGTNVKLDWPDQHGDAANISVSSRMVRLLFNMLIIVSAGLLKGGNISVRFNENEDNVKSVTVLATGEAVKWDEAFTPILADQVSEDEMDPKTVQLFLTTRIAGEIGARLIITHDENNIEMQATQEAPSFSVPEIAGNGESNG